MNWYLVTIIGTHKATQRKVQMAFRTMAEDGDKAQDRIFASYDLSGIEVDTRATRKEALHLWPVLLVRSEFIDDGPKDITPVPRNIQKPMP